MGAWSLGPGRAFGTWNSERVDTSGRLWLRFKERRLHDEDELCNISTEDEQSVLSSTQEMPRLRKSHTAVSRSNRYHGRKPGAHKKLHAIIILVNHLILLLFLRRASYELP